MKATDFAAKHNVTLATRAHAENRVGNKLPFRYKVKLTYNSNAYGTKYTMGCGHVRNGKAIPPNLANVLECLAMDCRAFTDNPTYQDFADCFGYDPDSIAGKKVWKACRKSFLRLRTLFGHAFAEFLQIED